VDESGIRFATWNYDFQGRATSSEHAVGVDKYSVTYQDAATTTITEPSLSSSDVQFGAMLGKARVFSRSQPAGSGCTASTREMDYDSNANVIRSDDFNGNRSCFAFDPGRNLETYRLDGLPKSKSCPADLAAYVPSAADALHPERKTASRWHPDLPLVAARSEPLKITTWTYNGQAGASCAPGSALLPDGKPIAVPCSRTEQATTDATGGAGFSATPTGPARTWSYTYDTYGHVLTETSPALSPTDTLKHTTTYAYYTDTSFSGGVGHAVGDLQKVTDPRGKVTRYTSYDQAGRLLSMTDANNTVTTMSYWPRGWLHARTTTPVTGTPQTTTYDYWPTGLLKRATLPDGSALNYGYDAAHRLTDVTDAAGNTVHYTLDNAGNRTAEQVKDASGRLAASVARVYDALNRLQSVTGAGQ
jgi:YD repeat-containing protein